MPLDIVRCDFSVSVFFLLRTRLRLVVLWFYFSDVSPDTVGGIPMLVYTLV